MRAPLVEAEQDGSVGIQDLTKVVMGRRRLGLAKERLVPFAAARNVPYADDRPCPFHGVCMLHRHRLLAVTPSGERGAGSAAAIRMIRISVCYSLETLQRSFEISGVDKNLYSAYRISQKRLN